MPCHIHLFNVCIVLAARSDTGKIELDYAAALKRSYGQLNILK
jgi:hypothetical protein